MLSFATVAVVSFVRVSFWRVSPATTVSVSLAVPFSALPQEAKDIAASATKANNNFFILFVTLFLLNELFIKTDAKVRTFLKVSTSFSLFF